MTAWKSLDKSLFDKCSEQMKIDEFIFTGDMDTHLIMSALEVNSKRIDSQLLANGIFDLSDLAAAGITIPDVELTIEEIRGIIGKLFDLQLSRFYGHSVFQTILISVYVCKTYEIKNKLLKYLINCFCHCFAAVEAYGNDSLPISSTYWIQSIGSVPEKIQDLIDAEELRSFLTKAKEENAEISDIVDTALFELDFADFIKEFPKKEIPKFPENIVATTNEIGIYPSIHFRRLPIHSPPPKVDIFDHEKSISIFKEFLGMCDEANHIKEEETVEGIIDYVYNWGVSHQNAISLIRILICGYIIQEEDRTFYRHIKSADFLKKDLLRFDIIPPFFKNDGFPIIARNLVYFIQNILTAFLGPPAFAHAAFNKVIFPTWNNIECSIISVEQKVGREWHYTSTGSKETDMILKMGTVLWASPISTNLLQYYIKLGFDTETYNSDDYAIGAILLVTAYRTIVYINDRKIKYDAIIKAAQHKKSPKKKFVVLKPGDIDRFITYPDDYYDAKAMHCYMFGCFNLFRWCLKKGAIKPHKGLFYNPILTYKDRAASPNGMFSISCMSTEEYADAYNYENVSAEEIEVDAKRYFNQAKMLIMEGMTKQGKTKERTDLLRETIAALTIFMWKEGMKVDVSFSETGNIKVALVK